VLTFYFAPGSSSLAAHIALQEVGCTFESRPLSFSRRETHTAEFLALNPAGKVPLLLIHGWPLTEVAGILFYLARRFPEAGLLPTDDFEAEARAVSWMSFVASSLHPARQLGKEAALEVWDVAEHRLGGNDWAIGQYSIADIHLFRLFWRFRASAGLSGDRFPNLSAHYDRMMARPAVRRTMEIEAAIGYELPA
jgi:glutathione S-transferase